jgi:hypothetical protein
MKTTSLLSVCRTVFSINSDRQEGPQKRALQKQARAKQSRLYECQFRAPTSPVSMKQTRIIPDIYLAAIYVGLGDKDQAFHYLDAAYQERVDRLVYLNVEPMSDPIRSDPRFAQLMAKIGLH